MTLEETARDTFGYEDLRPGQQQAMQAVLDGRDVLVVLPTGGGKSAVYQVPGVLLDGPTVVVSPLLALQRDQVAALRARGVAAVALNSTLRTVERAEVLEHLAETRFVYLAPEQLGNDEVRAALAAAAPARLVVDEAHCVCTWGHDFRPDYLRLADARRALGDVPVVALTATASPPVRAEIVGRLALRDPLEVVRGFDRPNLRFEVERAYDDGQRREAVVLRAMGEAKPGILYTATRSSADRYAAALSDLGLAAASYHAGRRAADREQVQAAFMAGELDVVVATSAFGMGIDKADVRFVLHAEVPDSIDSYYQEVGRAGRDGEPALALLHYREQDLGLRRFFSSGSPDPLLLRRAAALVRAAEEPVTVKALADELDLSRPRTTALVNLLEQAGAIEVLADGRMSGSPDPQEAAQAAVEVAERHLALDSTRVDMLRGYAETTDCRRQHLLGYFGEELTEPCGNCDTCSGGTARTVAEAIDSPYPLQSVVDHAEWGRGVVMRFEEDRLVVLFDETGYRTLSLEAVVSHGLLRLVSESA